MEQQHAPAPPPAQLARSRWTPTRQRIFLIALLDTGCVTHAARAAGMSRSSAQRLRLRLAGTGFDRAWQQALAIHAQRLHDPFARDAVQRNPAAPQARRSCPGAARLLPRWRRTAASAPLCRPDPPLHRRNRRVMHAVCSTPSTCPNPAA